MENKDETKKADNWAEMSDQDQEEEVEEVKNHVIKEAKKKIPPAQKGTKNSHGDYVVTTIDIPDMRVGQKKHDEEGNEVDDSSDSDTEYDDEDDVKETPVEEAKGKYLKID